MKSVLQDQVGCLAWRHGQICDKVYSCLGSTGKDRRLLVGEKNLWLFVVSTDVSGYEDSPLCLAWGDLFSCFKVFKLLVVTVEVCIQIPQVNVDTPPVRVLLLATIPCCCHQFFFLCGV